MRRILLIFMWVSVQAYATPPFQFDLHTYVHLFESQLACFNALSNFGFDPVPRGVQEISDNDFYDWDDKALNAHLEVPVAFRSTGWALSTQMMVAKERFEPNDQIQFDRFWKESYDRKNRDFDFDASKLHEARQFYGQGPTDAQIIEGLGLNSVEIGAWKIVLKSGKEIWGPPFTSRSYDGISGESLISSVNELLRTNHLSLSDLASLNFFHTHPGLEPDARRLSWFDENVTTAFRSMLILNGAPEVDVSASALWRDEHGKTFVTMMVAD